MQGGIAGAAAAAAAAVLGAYLALALVQQPRPAPAAVQAWLAAHAPDTIATLARPSHLRGPWGRWDMAALLSRANGTLDRVYSAPDGGGHVFLYEDRKRQFVGAVPLPPPNYTRRTLARDELARALHTGQPSVYYSHDVARHFAPLVAELPLLDQLVMPDTTDRAAGQRRLASINVWLGAAGTTAVAHCDPTHNWFVQLAGHKRFVLVPPRHAPALQLYPGRKNKRIKKARVFFIVAFSCPIRPFSLRSSQMSTRVLARARLWHAMAGFWKRSRG